VAVARAGLGLEPDVLVAITSGKLVGEIRERILIGQIITHESDVINKIMIKPKRRSELFMPPSPLIYEAQ
jgi:hypothetical protein